MAKKNDRGPAGNTAPKNNPISAPTIKQQAGPASVRDQIKAAGSNGNISKNELLKISDSSGKSTDQIIRQLDKVNANGSSNNKAPIGVGNAAFNSLLKTPTSKTLMGKTMGELGLSNPYADFGTGAIGKAIGYAKGTTDYYGGSTPGTGRIPQGQQVFGSYNGSPQLQIKPQNFVNAGFTGPGGGNGGGNNGGGDGGTGGAAAGGGDGDLTTPTITPDEKIDPIAVSGGTGSSVDGGATSFRRKKSSGRSSGLTTRGTGQFRNSLKVGSASGVNIGM